MPEWQTDGNTENQKSVKILISHPAYKVFQSSFLAPLKLLQGSSHTMTPLSRETVQSHTDSEMPQKCEHWQRNTDSEIQGQIQKIQRKPSKTKGVGTPLQKKGIWACFSSLGHGFARHFVEMKPTDALHLPTQVRHLENEQKQQK